MSKNGFFHEYPYSQDIYVSPEMEKQFNGKQHINARVTNACYDEQKHIIGDCFYEGNVYQVRNESFLDQVYWLLIA